MKRSYNSSFGRLVPLKTKKARLMMAIPRLVRRSPAFNPEKKEVQTSAAMDLFTAGPTSINCLNAIAVGTDETNRLGRKIQLKSCQLNMTFATTSASNIVWYQIAVVYDRQTNAGSVAIGDIFDATVGTPDNYFHATTKNQERFTILALEKGNVITGQVAANVNRYINLDKVLRGKDKSTNYSGTTSAATEINSGAIFLCVLTRSLGIVTTGNGMIGNWQTKVRFVDL